jgi:hypothetical protein
MSAPLKSHISNLRSRYEANDIILVRDDALSKRATKTKKETNLNNHGPPAYPSRKSSNEDLHSKRVSVEEQSSTSASRSLEDFYKDVAPRIARRRPLRRKTLPSSILKYTSERSGDQLPSFDSYYQEVEQIVGHRRPQNGRRSSLPLATTRWQPNVIWGPKSVPK